MRFNSNERSGQGSTFYRSENSNFRSRYDKFQAKHKTKTMEMIDHHRTHRNVVAMRTIPVQISNAKHVRPRQIIVTIQTIE